MEKLFVLVHVGKEGPKTQLAAVLFRSVVSVLGLDTWIEDNNPVLRLSLGCEEAYSAGREGIGMFSL